MSDPIDPRVRILDDLIQRGIRQEAQDQWQSLLDRSDRRTNPTRYWVLLRKLSGKRAPQPPNMEPTTLGKLEVMQNAALRIASGNVLMAPISHLHSETKVLPLPMHLKLCGEQFYASALQTAHPSHDCVTRLYNW